MFLTGRAEEEEAEVAIGVQKQKWLLV